MKGIAMAQTSLVSANPRAQVRIELRLHQLYRAWSINLKRRRFPATKSSGLWLLRRAPKPKAELLCDETSEQSIVRGYLAG